jgi:hypothetical protein
MSVSDLVLELVEGGDLLEYILKYKGVRECLPRLVRCSLAKYLQYSRGGCEAYFISNLRCALGKGLLLFYHKLLTFFPFSRFSIYTPRASPIAI